MTVDTVNRGDGQRGQSDMAEADGRFVTGPVELSNAALFTDLYELTMAASYFREGMRAPATFSLFVRKLPSRRSYLIAAGLPDVLDYLASLRFSDESLSYLRSLDLFAPDFLDFLRDLRFTGSVRAVPEGTLVFGDEPILEVTAPILEAQIVETAVLNFCHLQTLLASKASRLTTAARGRTVVDFGLRRTHGLDAGLKAARCAFLAGADMSSNVLAAFVYGIPPAGTMAHSYVEAFPCEIDSFRAFARAFPLRSTLLIDTYDTRVAAGKAVRVAKEMEARGQRLSAVRLDSGDLLELSKDVRAILDAAGLGYVRIFASSGLDEDEVARLLEHGAPIDAFGIGTRLNVSADAPYLDMAYKLVEYDGRKVLKLSEGKRTWVGQKQVFRRRDGQGWFAGDVIGLAEEEGAPGSEPLLAPVMASGRLTRPHPPLLEVRRHCAAQVAALPDEFRRLRDPGRYPVRVSAYLAETQSAQEARVRVMELEPWTTGQA
jgi:nicotinate phosphoribosyltransferase